ncbi:MAG: Stp1/IreP family PP2C-type Ser/Thr phosphatase [Candidatus Contendobacter sp.]|nr:Stp1/IreP family PP2C-type Ser/Thr phosphatase [Candidatus Contendobacter sp.]MDS4060692.1 Stp1/IreP family PP2C-type Ser/Thr phosphatase [Candidatus Contendobacter sp.]
MTDTCNDRAFGMTDPGKIRENNEDSFLLLPEKNLYIVADGMGGHNAGEVASSHAVTEVDNYLSPQLLMKIQGQDNRIRQELRNCLREVNLRIRQQAKAEPRYAGMGCTLVVALVDGDRLHLGHIGDSRAYRCAAIGITALTTDHSVVMELVRAGAMTEAEARASSLKNELTQAIGVRATITPDYGTYTLQPDDWILLCTDGLWDMLTDAEIWEIVRQAKPLAERCQELIDRANAAGGQDNITVVLIAPGGE